jgi:tetratricopeptide (TPR) repeat protein
LGTWITEYNALYDIHEGKYRDAQALFESLAADTGDSAGSWAFWANIAVTQEKLYDYKNAVTSYIKAEGLLPPDAFPPAENIATASRLLVAAARCQRMLGKRAEARAILDAAALGDPNNAAIRLEQGRLGDGLTEGN